MKNKFSKILYRLVTSGVAVMFLLPSALNAAPDKGTTNRMSQRINAAEFTVKGTVSSAEKEALPGVTIVVKGTSQGTTTMPTEISL